MKGCGPYDAELHMFVEQPRAYEVSSAEHMLKNL